MVVDLIDFEEVTTKKLLALLKSAYIQAEELRDNPDAIYIRLGGSEFFLVLNNNKISLLDFMTGFLVNGCEKEIYRKLNELNDTYFCKVVFVEQASDTTPSRIRVQYELRFGKGLNCSQLIDDIHFFLGASRAVFNEFSQYLSDNKFLRQSER